MRRIVLVNQTTNYLTIDVANAFTEKFDEVVLIAGGIANKERLYKNVICRNIIKYNRNSVVKRLYTWAVGTLQIFINLAFRYKKSDICYFTNPPSSYLPQLLLPSRRYTIVVYDLFPDSLKVINIGENNFLYILWARLNKKLFSDAYRIITLSDGMFNAVSQYVDSSRIEIIPNWSSFTESYSGDRKNSLFINQNQLSNKFLVIYSGNLGFDYNMDVLVDVADSLREHKDIEFVIIGEGGKKQSMIDSSKRKQLPNIIFLPYQPIEHLQETFASADIAVVALGDERLDVSMPSKIYDLISTGAPLLCIGGLNSELALFVAQYDNGKCFRKHQVKEMSDFILTCYNDRNFRITLSNNSIEASHFFKIENAKKYVY